MKKLYWYKNHNKFYSVGLHINVEESHSTNTKSWWQGREYNYEIYNYVCKEGVWNMPNPAFKKKVGMKLSILMNFAALNIAKEKDDIK